MNTQWFLSRMLAAALSFPTLAVAVTLDPGQVGNFFLYTNTGTVDALDGNSFRIEFSEQKFILITPYEEDAAFLFGIDFDGTEIEPATLEGYLTDSLGNAIAGTDFTGLGLSAGFGGGRVELNEEVVAYGAFITFTGTVPAAPFPVRMGSGVASNVFEDRPVIGQGDAPEPVDISIDSVAVCSGTDYFEFEVSATGTNGEMVFRIAADTDPDPANGPTERITTQINALTGEVNSEAEPIAESFGSPLFDRWEDGYLGNYSVVRVGTDGSSWTFSGRVPQGADPFAPGDSLWGVTLGEGEAEIVTEPVEIAACVTTITEVSVPVRNAPQLDGRIDYREWPVAPQLQLSGGSITFMHDKNRLYMLINMLGDGSDHSLRNGGPDQLSILFDIDEDSAVSADLDRRYRMLEESGNFRFETWAEADGNVFNPPEDLSFSALAEGFGCFVFDGSATIIPLSCSRHRVWEVALDLLEIEAASDKTARLGLRIQSEIDEVETFPADLTDLEEFIRLQLEGLTNMDEPSRGPPDAALTLADFVITQGIQREDRSLSLVASRKGYFDVLVDTAEGIAEDVITSLFASRDGVDLPGSPFTSTIRYNFTWGTANIRSGENRQTHVLPGKDLEGEMSFRLVARQPQLGASITTEEQPISFLDTRDPVYWIVPFNTGGAANPNLPGNEFLQRSQLDVLASFPVVDVDFVRRPPLVENPETGDDAIDLLNQYDQQALLAWTLGLIFTGEAPFALPDQIIGAFPADKDFDDTIGLSDPLWWQGGAGRVVWIKDVIADAGLLLPHEINHNLDTNIQGSWGRHVMGCGSGGLNPQWPYPNMQIQQPGLISEDIVARNGVLLSPPRRVDASTPDYMSYCRAVFRPGDSVSEAYPFQWVSPYRWRLQIEEVFAGDAATPSALRASNASAPAAAATVEDVLYVTGQINQDGSGQLDPVVMQPGIASAQQLPGDYELRLVDCRDGILSSRSFAASFENVEGQPRANMGFAMVLPDPGLVCGVELRSGNGMLDRLTLSDNAPLVSVQVPNGGEPWTGRHAVSWDVADADGDPTTASILYSPDGGARWLPVAGGITGTEYMVDSTGLPGSEQALIRVLITDGLQTVYDDSDAPFTVENKAPTVTIVSPAAAGILPAGQAVILRGMAWAPGGISLPGDDFVWSLNGELIATGNLVSALLEPGEHQLSLLATSTNGLSGESFVTLRVAEPDRDGDGVADDDDSCPDSVPGSLVTLADCPTEAANVLYADGCSLEELVNASLSRDGRDGLIDFMKNLRKGGQLPKADQKSIKKCVREDE